VRLAVNVIGGLIAVYWLDLGMIGFFASVAVGFVVYAALLVWAVVRVKEPDRRRSREGGLTVRTHLHTLKTLSTSEE
jgi:hypothetical protein